MSEPEPVPTEPITDELDLEPEVSAPSGWRRVIIGLVVGLVAGALLALLLPKRREQPTVVGAGDDAPLESGADPLSPDPTTAEGEHGDAPTR